MEGNLREISLRKQYWNWNLIKSESSPGEAYAEGVKREEALHIPKVEHKPVGRDQRELRCVWVRDEAGLWLSYVHKSFLSDEIADSHEENMTNTIFIFYPMERFEQYWDRIGTQWLLANLTCVFFLETQYLDCIMPISTLGER